MSDSNKQPSYSDTMVEFKELLEDIPAYFRQAPEGQRRILLDFLANWKHSLRRKHPRKSCTIPVDFAAGDHAFTSLIQDVGPGGVFIEATRNIAVGQQIALIFSLPKLPRPTKLKGEIVWKNVNGFGVKFKSTRYLEEHLEKVLGPF